MEAMTTTNKQTIILNAIRNGDATRESLMELAQVNKAGLNSQLAYLNNRGLAMAEVDEARAEFPILENGFFKIGTFAEYKAKRENVKPQVEKPAKTAEQVMELAQKREDKASAAYAKAQEKADANPDDQILAMTKEVRRLDLELATLKLSKVQAGDFTYEHVRVEADADANATPAPKINKRERPNLV